MSWPSKRISPALASSRRMISLRGRALAAARLADDPERLAAPHLEADAVDGLDRADPAPEDDPARDREVLDEVAHLARAARRARGCAAASGRGSLAALTPVLPGRRAPSDSACSARASPSAPAAPTGRRRVSASSRHATWCVGLAGHRLEPRIDARVLGLGVGAARVEVAARRRVRSGSAACPGSARAPPRAAPCSVGIDFSRPHV